MMSRTHRKELAWLSSPLHVDVRVSLSERDKRDRLKAELDELARKPLTDAALAPKPSECADIAIAVKRGLRSQGYWPGSGFASRGAK